MDTSPTRTPVRRNRHIHEVLRDNIRDGRLEAGLVLTESALSRLFNVSRAPAADALSRLMQDGLVTRHDGRGYLVGDGSAPVLRKSLDDAGLVLPDQAEGLGPRGWRGALYPAIEAEVAGCISYGTFGLTGAAMAKHLGVSRIVTQDILARLERVGLVEQGANGRWIAPRLTVQSARDHYQMRRLLEPVALVDGARQAGPALIAEARARIADLRIVGFVAGPDMNAVEHDLHRQIVLSCTNPQMRDAIQRCQLPLIVTHLAFNRYRHDAETARVLDDHDSVLAALQEGDGDRAAALMAAHLDHGLRTTTDYLERPPAPLPGPIPAYMTRIA
jgi:DNA-binding GntR family transcriptional regulator